MIDDKLKQNYQATRWGEIGRPDEEENKTL